MITATIGAGANSHLDFIPTYNSSNLRCTPGMANKLMKNLSSSKYFTRYNGADHVFLWSLGQYHPWPYNDCDIIMRSFCALCTFTCYWMDPTKVTTINSFRFYLWAVNSFIFRLTTSSFQCPFRLAIIGMMALKTSPGTLLCPLKGISLRFI